MCNIWKHYFARYMVRNASIVNDGLTAGSTVYIIKTHLYE